MNILKLKQIRKSKGYTLAELSTMIGCTSSHLSQLERGIKQPSLEMLRRICDCLDVSIYELLSGNDHVEINAPGCRYSVIRHNKRKKFMMPEIMVEYEFVTPYAVDGSDNTRIVGMCTTLKPGRYSCEKPVALDFDFSSFVIQGEATVIVGDDSFLVEKGDSIYVYAGAYHNFYNSGDTELVMIGYGERQYGWEEK